MRWHRDRRIAIGVYPWAHEVLRQWAEDEQVPVGTLVWRLLEPQVLERRKYYEIYDGLTRKKGQSDDEQ